MHSLNASILLTAKRKCSLLTLLVLHVWVFVLHSQMYSYTCVLPNPTTRRQKNSSPLGGGIYQGCQNPWIYQQYNKITKVFQTIRLGHNHITYRIDRVSISHLDLVKAERKREISWPCAWRFTNCPTNEFCDQYQYTRIEKLITKMEPVRPNGISHYNLPAFLFWRHR